MLGKLGEIGKIVYIKGVKGPHVIIDVGTNLVTYKTYYWVTPEKEFPSPNHQYNEMGPYLKKDLLNETKKLKEGITKIINT